MTALRVLFAPWYPDNPYQELLRGALAERGVEVRGVAALKVARPSFRAELEQFQPHILHLHWLHPYVVAPGLLASLARTRAFLDDLRAARRARVPVVFTAHNLVNHEGLHPRIDRFATRRVLALAEVVIAHGASAAGALAAEFGDGVRAKTAIVPIGSYAAVYPQGVERAAARAELGLDPAAFVPAFVGRVRAYKGIDELFQAFRAARLQAGSTLLVAGKAGDDRTRIRLKRRAKKTPGVLLHYGHVPDGRLQTYLAAADAVVLPYSDVLSSSAAVLAASFSCAVVAPALGCIRDALDPSGGVFYDPAAAGGLARALEEAAARRAELPALGARNRAASDQWPWSRVAALTHDVYARVQERTR